MWHLLKGHHHLQDEFSVFFDHLRPAASRMGDFEEINWTEEKEYEVGPEAAGAGGLQWGPAQSPCRVAPPSPQFDGFEEVALPDVEEEEEAPKTPTASKSKRRKEIGVQSHDKVDPVTGVAVRLGLAWSAQAACRAGRGGLGRAG